MRKRNYYLQVLKMLHDLHTSYPEYNMGRHVSTAMFDYGDFWGISDKEMLFALQKYKTQLDMDVPHTGEKEIDEIIKDAMNLDEMFNAEDDLY